MSDWEHFSDDELRCRCGCGRVEMNHRFMNTMEQIRVEADFPFPVTSAYRCPRHNNDVSRTGYNGPHVQGRAMDVRVRGEQAVTLLTIAIKHGITGFGINQKGASRFIHLDDIDSALRPMIWSY